MTMSNQQLSDRARALGRNEQRVADVQLLLDLKRKLPLDHHQRPGLSRAIEALRAIPATPQDTAGSQHE